MNVLSGLTTIDSPVRPLREPEERPTLRPGSNVLPSSKPRPRRTLDQSSSSLPRAAQSARRRNPPSRTLLPLVPSLSQASAARSIEEVIRGTRLWVFFGSMGTPPGFFFYPPFSSEVMRRQSEITLKTLPFQLMPRGDCVQRNNSFVAPAELVMNCSFKKEPNSGKKVLKSSMSRKGKLLNFFLIHHKCSL